MRAGSTMPVQRALGEAEVPPRPRQRGRSRSRSGSPAALPYKAGGGSFCVVVEERQRSDGRRTSVRMRWWDTQRGNWRLRSLEREASSLFAGKHRDRTGNLRPEVVRWAIDQGEIRALELATGARGQVDEATKLLTLSEGLELTFDAWRGAYPPPLNLHARTVRSEVKRAIGILGENRTWASIKSADLRDVWRQRIKTLVAEGKTGCRGAENTVSRFLTVAAWLRDEELLDPDACMPPGKWRDKLRGDWRTMTGSDRNPEPSRPRYTKDEARRILEAAREVDPRFDLALELGAQARLGQVIRCRRSDLNLEARTLTVGTAGKKKGVLVELTDREYDAVTYALNEGYLRNLEAGEVDYRLFPQGQLSGGRKGNDPVAVERHLAVKPVDRRSLLTWLHAAEEKAGVESVPGRANYGLRRLMLDAAVEGGLDPEAVQEFGGWTDSDTPNRVYRDKVRKEAARRARDARARIKGDVVQA